MKKSGEKTSTLQQEKKKQKNKNNKMQK